MKAEGLTVASWVTDMVAAGNESFYKSEGGKRLFYNRETKGYDVVPGTEQFIILDNFRSQTPVQKNSETILHDIGDGVLCLEFTSKANSIGEGVLKGINDAITLAEEGNWNGLVIGNNATNFTVGANLMMIGMFAFQQEWDELNQAVRIFQDTTMRCRYSAIPVVAATQGYTFGGGCETIMHCDAAVCAAESYIGLVEVGVGLIPGGAGTKEMALRASDEFFAGDVMIPTLIEKFKTIALASVATSAPEAFKQASWQRVRQSPPVGRSMPSTTCRRLDLPAPLRPTSPVAEPFEMDQLSSFSTADWPRFRDKALSSMGNFEWMGFMGELGRVTACVPHRRQAALQEPAARRTWRRQAGGSRWQQTSGFGGARRPLLQPVPPRGAPQRRSRALYGA